MPSIKLNKSTIDKLTFGGKQIDYFDTDLKGFGLRVGKESKTFFARKEVNGKPIRKTIGRLGAWTPDLAREEAKKLLRQMDQGVDPREEERRARDASLTVDDAFANYLKHRRLRPATITSYGFVRNLYLQDWKGMALGSITRADVLAMHRQVTTERGAPSANLAMIVFGSIWNYAHVHLENPPMSPTRVLAAASAWHPNNRRKDRLLPAQFPAFAEAMKFLRHTLHDAVLLALHTGMRSSEVEGLRWENVDLQDRVFTARDTKNGTDLVLPMSSPILAMFKRRQALDDGSPFVFKGQGRSGLIRLDAQVIHRIGFDKLTAHGLRRTFRALCETLNFPRATIKRLMNHSLDSDITDSYLSLEVDDLRPYLDRISAEIERLQSYPLTAMAPD